MPFYERLSDRRLEVGKTVRIGPGSKKAEVDIWGDNLALVSPGKERSNGFFHTGDYDERTKKFKGFIKEMSERLVVEQKSISTHRRYPQIIWKPQ